MKTIDLDGDEVVLPFDKGDKLGEVYSPGSKTQQYEEVEDKKLKTKKYRSMLKITGPLLTKDTSLQKRGYNESTKCPEKSRKLEKE